MGPTFVSILVLVEYPSELKSPGWFTHNHRRFQSLFWWNILLNLDAGIFINTPRLRFQSLFWWNILLNVVARILEVHTDPGFNPCSGGISF